MFCHPDARVEHVLERQRIHGRARSDADLIMPSNRGTISSTTKTPVLVDQNIGATSSSSGTSPSIPMFSLKYPSESSSALKLQLERMMLSETDSIKSKEIVSTILKGYDEKLSSTDKMVSELKEQVKNDQELIEKLLSENNELRRSEQTIDKLKHQIELLMEENSILIEEKRRNEPLVEGAYLLQKEIDDIKSKEGLLDRQATRKLREEHETMSDRLREYEVQVRDLLDENQRFRDTQKKWSTDMDGYRFEKQEMEERIKRVQKWYLKVKGRVEEYEDCCQELGILEWLPNFDLVDKDQLAGEGILLHGLRKLKREYLLAKKKLQDEVGTHIELEKAHTGLIQRYQMDLNKSEDTTRVLQDHFEEMKRTLQVLKHERDSLQASVNDQSKELVVLRTKLKDTMKDAENSEEGIINKTRQQIQRLQEQWALEREQMQREIYALKKHKVDMQVEIGHLLREKRASELHVTDVLKDLDISRERFKSQVLFK